MKGYDVAPIPRQDAIPWIKLKHYARRIPLITHCFGLFKKGEIKGVCTFAPPPSPHLCRGLCGKRYTLNVLEFNRMCLEDNKKNEASFFISKSIRLIEKPKIFVSYADTRQNHVGYIYQATNWLFTGSPVAHDAEYLVDGKVLHSKGLRTMGIKAPKKWARENKIKIIKPKPKHRYIYFTGTKKQKKEMLAALRYPILPYPKGESKRYDTSKKFPKQTTLWRH